MTSTLIACSSCGITLADAALVCDACGGLPELAFLRPLLDAPTLRALFRLRRTSDDPLDRSGVWRFRELLPAIERRSIVTLQENNLPLHRAALGAEYSGVDDLQYLHYGVNPTASFKDGGMTVAVSHARSRGARAVVCASTGNTSASMAAYAARAGLRAIVLLPAEGISAAKLAQTLDFGAHLIAVDGDFDFALAAVRSIDPARVVVVNSVNPYRIEGQKTALLGLFELLAWEPPDWIVLPGGNLGNTSAYGKCLREAMALGLIERLPRLAVVQASGAAPFVRVARDGGPLIPVRAVTEATAIRIGAPASWRRALDVLHQTRGVAIDVSDDEIGDARAVIGRDGIGCEPGSAASLAGLLRLRQAGIVEKSDRVVAVLTGHMLKDTAFAARYHESDRPFANHVVRAGADALERAIDDALAI